MASGVGSHRNNGQQGAVLVLLLMLFVVGGIAAFTTLQDIRSVEKARYNNDREVLLKAKHALIAYAAFNGDMGENDKPGELPCPDHDYDGTVGVGDGVSGQNCLTYRGWFPFGVFKKEQSGEPLVDSSGHRLWYAISDAWQKNNQQSINDDTGGALMLDDQSVVAIVIAGGEALSFQNARGNVLDPEPDVAAMAGQFLDYWNSDGDSTNPDDAEASLYYSKYNNNPPPLGGEDGYEYANDILLGLTADEIMRVARVKALEYAKNRLSVFYSIKGYFPFAGNSDNQCQEAGPARNGLLPTDEAGNCEDLSFHNWFEEAWQDRIYYIVSEKCQPGTNNCDGIGDYLEFNGRTARVIVVLTGERLDGIECDGGPYNQDRVGSSNICDYLETTENTNMDNVYVTPLPDQSNDTFLPFYVD